MTCGPVSAFLIYGDGSVRAEYARRLQHKADSSHSRKCKCGETGANVNSTAEGVHASRSAPLPPRPACGRAIAHVLAGLSPPRASWFETAPLAPPHHEGLRFRRERGPHPEGTPKAAV